MADIVRVFREWQQQPLGEVLVGMTMAGDPETDVEEWETVASDALPVCHHCILPQHPAAYFCFNCGRATGPYNNILPFERIASMGEVARSAVSAEARFSPLRTLGYVLFGLLQYQIFSPLYFIRLYRNYRRLASGDGCEAEQVQEPTLSVEESVSPEEADASIRAELDELARETACLLAPLRRTARRLRVGVMLMCVIVAWLITQSLYPTAALFAILVGGAVGLLLSIPLTYLNPAVRAGRRRLRAIRKREGQLRG